MDSSSDEDEDGVGVATRDAKDKPSDKDEEQSEEEEEEVRKGVTMVTLPEVLTSFVNLSVSQIQDWTRDVQEETADHGSAPSQEDKEGDKEGPIRRF